MHWVQSVLSFMCMGVVRPSTRPLHPCPLQSFAPLWAMHLEWWLYIFGESGNFRRWGQLEKVYYWKVLRATLFSYFCQPGCEELSPTPTCLHNCIRWNNQELNPLKPWAKINPPSFTLLEPAIWSQWWWTDQYALIISCCSSVNMGRASYTS